MKIKLCLAFLVFLLAGGASFGQGVRFTSQVSQQGTVATSTNVVVLPPAPIINFCKSPASGSPCANKATTYTDSTLTTACSTSTQIVLDGTNSCVASPDAQNNWGVWLAPGQYTYTVTIGTQNFGPYFVTAAGATPITGLICDGVTDNTATWNAFMAQVQAAGVPVHVTLPAGKCEGTTFLSIPDNVQLDGAGKNVTILQQKAGTNSSNQFLTINGTLGTNITISNLTVDGNLSAQIGGGGRLLFNSTANVSNISIHDTRWINAGTSAILLFPNTPNTYDSNISITNNEFASNGFNGSSTGDTNCTWGDINIFNPQHVKVTNNFSSGANGNFACVGGSTSPNSSDVIISNNIATALQGFGAALGDILSNATITGNDFSAANSRENIIDIGDAQFVTVTSNNIISGGPFCTVACGGIGDGPASNHVAIGSNTIVGNAGPLNVCITSGGQDVSITGNTCRGSGQAGIAMVAQTSLVVQGINISGNTVSNCGLGATGHAGIEFFVANSNPGSFNDITVTGNRVYDDQGSKTCGYGVGLGNNGLTSSGYNGFLIANNDLRDNLTNGVLNNVTPRNSGLAVTGLSIIIRDNPGFNPASDQPITLTAQAASLGFTPIFTVPTNNVNAYLVCVNETLTRSGTTSTLPTVHIDWNDRLSGGTIDAQFVPATPTGNTTNTSVQGCVPAYPVGGAAIQYETTGYASTGTVMQYALQIFVKPYI